MLVFDPHRVTNFDRPKWALELFILFGVLVANRDADRTAEVVDRLLRHVGWRQKTGVFAALRGYYRKGRRKEFDHERLAVDLLALGMGQYRRKALYVRDLLAADVDLRTCTELELAAIRGIKWKTLKMFLIHSRRGYRGACLDTHHLRILRRKYPEYNVPEQTPSNPTEYARIEHLALMHIDDLGADYAEYDLWRWEEERLRPLAERRRARPGSPALTS